MLQENLIMLFLIGIWRRVASFVWKSSFICQRGKMYSWINSTGPSKDLVEKLDDGYVWSGLWNCPSESLSFFDKSFFGWANFIFREENQWFEGNHDQSRNAVPPDWNRPEAVVAFGILEQIEREGVDVTSGFCCRICQHTPALIMLHALQIGLVQMLRFKLNSAVWICIYVSKATRTSWVPPPLDNGWTPW